MKIRIIKQTAIGGATVRVDDVVDAGEADAMTLIRMHKAVEVIEPPAPVVIAPSTVEAPVKRKPRARSNGNLPTNA